MTMFYDTIVLATLVIAFAILAFGFFVYYQLKLNRLRKEHAKLVDDINRREVAIVKARLEEARLKEEMAAAFRENTPDLYDQMTQQHDRLDQDRLHVKKSSTPPIPRSNSSALHHDMKRETQYSSGNGYHRCSDHSSAGSFLGGALLGGAIGSMISDSDDENKEDTAAEETTNSDCDCNCDCNCDCDCSSDCNCDCNCDCSD